MPGVANPAVELNHPDEVNHPDLSKQGRNHRQSRLLVSAFLFKAVCEFSEIRCEPVCRLWLNL